MKGDELKKGGNMTTDAINELRKLSKPISEWIEKNGNPNVSVLIGLEDTKVLMVEAGLPTLIND